jgi:hypothetical protein
MLMILMAGADRSHLFREHIAGYGFLFTTPWAWLIDWGGFPAVHSLGYARLSAICLFSGFLQRFTPSQYGFRSS